MLNPSGNELQSKNHFSYFSILLRKIGPRSPYTQPNAKIWFPGNFLGCPESPYQFSAKSVIHWKHPPRPIRKLILNGWPLTTSTCMQVLCCLRPLKTNLRLSQAVVGASTESDDQQAGHRHRRLAAHSLGGRPQISFDIKQVACGVVHPTTTNLPPSLTHSLTGAH